MTDARVLARPSGGFAMLAVDQREALRAMMTDARGGTITDATLTEFKVAAARVLSPYASGILVDPQFGWEAVTADGAVADTCAAIAAVDLFTPNEREFVAQSVIDDSLDLAQFKQQGAKALKLLVLWRPDESSAGRIAMVRDFVARCRAHDLVSIVEPVSRGPIAGGECDLEAGVIAAARELGDLGADIYKSEVPTHGHGTDAELTDGCKELTDLINGPWVVLSSGVPADRFPDAVRLACRAGASGFLAGRAVWASVVGAENWTAELERVSVPRLRRLGEIVDDSIG